MLPKKKRVTKNTFNTIMEKGSIVSGSFFILRYIKENPPQCAFVVPKKIAKKAILRNSLRRKGYNIIRDYKLNLFSGLFFFKKESINIPVSELRNDIDSILKRIKII